jgi:RNA polymerase sigma factor (sigma-70 family)
MEWEVRVMAVARAGSVLQHLRRVLARAPGPEVGDAELLERFVRWGDQAAFELLVWRHQRMVLGVCRRVLGNLHDAEDAFQATFLVLARKAASIGNRQALAGWLHRVASRVARHARSRAARQPRAAAQGADLDCLPCPREPGAELLAGELGAVLDEELGRLPEHYRVPLVLCYLEGKTYEEAARQLRCPKGTVSGRLTRARHMLKARLTRREVGLGAGLLAAGLCEHAASAAVPAALVAATVKAALLVASGRAAAVATSPEVAALAEGVLRSMLFHKVKFVSVLLAALVACVGAGTYAAALHAGDPAQPSPAEKSVPAPPARGPYRVVQGDARPAAGAGRPRLVDADAAVDAVSWSPDGKVLATRVRAWDGDGHVTGRFLQIRDADTGAVRRTLEQSDDLEDARFSPDGKSVAAAITAENVVKLWDARTGKEKRTFEGAKCTGLTSVAFSRDGRLLAAAGVVNNADSGQGVLILWKAASGNLLWQVRGHTSDICERALAFSPDGKLLATGSADKTIKLWDATTGKCKRTLEGHESGVFSLAFSPDGKLLASGGLDGTVRLWDLESAELKFLESGYIRGLKVVVAFSPDGRWLAAGGTILGNTAYGRGDVRLFDAKTGKLHRAFPDVLRHGVSALAFSPGGETLAVGNWDKQLLLLPLKK